MRGLGFSGHIGSRIAQWAARQYGHVTRAQLLAIGLSERTISRWIARGKLIPVHVGVYAVGYLRPDAVARAAAALLACGPDAVLSHETAAAHWGFAPKWPERPEVAGPRDRRRPGIRYHHTRTLTRRDIRRHQGLRVTSPARTLIDIAPRLTRSQRARAVNDARLRGLLKGPELEGLAHLTAIRSRPTRSRFEDEFPAFARAHGLPEPEINAHVAGYEVDVLFPRERVIVELDSWEHHQDRSTFESDRERDAATLEAGHVTVRMTWERYTGRPKAEAARLGEILRERRASAQAA
ncbi:MAG: type IV toxin-antitoxin system AbiEi family antitoxin domain-containing protein [Solirubrobacteraceae bacterium]